MEKPQESQSTPEIDWLALARTAHYRASELAHLLGIVLRQLERCFAESCRIAPQEWLDGVRLWTAARLLIEGQKPKHISPDLEFSDHSAFFHKFKEYHGCTPREYLRNRLHPPAHCDERLRELFPGEQPPGNWRNHSEPVNALEILRRMIRRSDELPIHYLQRRCRS